MSIHVKTSAGVGDATPYINHNGIIKIPTSGWLNEGGTIKQIWPPIASDGSVYIYNQATLETFRDRVNAGETSLNGIVIADFTVSGEWTPIIDYVEGSSRQYNGTFDGGGHTITGLTTRSNESYGGLFGCIGSEGAVKNVKVASDSLSGYQHVGGIAGGNYGTVTGCEFSGTVTTSYGPAGCIVGWNRGGTVSNNTNLGTVTASSLEYVGGIVGRNYNGGIVENNTNKGDIGTGSYSMGGIVGMNESSTVTNNTNEGVISGGGSVGGIVAYNGGGGTVSDNNNIGTVTSTSGSAGGIVGYHNTSGSTVSGNTNSGEVISTSGNAGGIVGRTASYATVTENNNSGNVTSTSSNAGGIVGYNGDGVNVSSNINSGTITSGSRAGGIVGYNPYSSATVSGNTNTGTVTGETINEEA